MGNSVKPILTSFKICPFVQRSVITMLRKKVDYDIQYIDLAHKPDWFLKISPFGKVPVMQVGDDVIFESAVINEYLDETNLPALHPSDPILRAQNRAWIEFGSDLIMTQFSMLVSDTEQTFETKRSELSDKFRRLEDQIKSTPFFNGADFSLVDTAYAPIFMRLNIIDRFYDLDIFKGMPKIKAWSVELLRLECVQQSVVPEFSDLFVGFLKNKGGYIAQFLR